MKNTLFLMSGIILIILTSANLPESGSETKNETGIAFHQGTWNEALQLSKEQGKPIFLNISACWCGPCKRLKSKTFPNQEVGKFYNTNFINVAVDGEKEKGLNLLKNFKLGVIQVLFISTLTESLLAKQLDTITRVN